MNKIRVSGVVLVRDGRVLLQHRDEDPTIRYPGWWAIFGGHVEDHETPEEAAIREIEEELGLRLEPPLRLIHEGEDKERRRSYYVSPLEVPLSALTLGEGQGMALLDRSDLERLPVVPIQLTVLRELFDVEPLLKTP